MSLSLYLPPMSTSFFVAHPEHTEDIHPGHLCGDTNVLNHWETLSPVGHWLVSSSSLVYIYIYIFYAHNHTLYIYIYTYIYIYIYIYVYAWIGRNPQTVHPFNQVCDSGGGVLASRGERRRGLPEWVPCLYVYIYIYIYIYMYT